MEQYKHIWKAFAIKKKTIRVKIYQKHYLPIRNVTR